MNLMICGECGQDVRMGICGHCPHCGELLPDLEELEQHEDLVVEKCNKKQIREKFLADPGHSFAVAYRLVLAAAEEENPAERIRIIGEVAKEFGVDISDCSI